uniref:Iwr1 domain-containing protein n=1 Tax=Macrostomum lignano TaxID=282301 RepID=A0A1I8GYT9_9PLAT
MSTPVVLRVKKRKLASLSGGAIAATASAAQPDNADEEATVAAVRLLLQQPPNAKRAKLSEQQSGGLFVYAGRVSSADVDAAEAAVRRAIGKRKLGTEADRLRRRLGERPSEGEGRLVYKRRKRAQPTEKDSEQIACNGVAMTTKKSADKTDEAAVSQDEGDENCKDSNRDEVDSESDGDVYYDLYYGYSDACIARGPLPVPGSESQQEHQQMQFLLQAYEEAYSYADDSDAVGSSGGGCFTVIDGNSDDSDSNSESNWRNEYPDTPSEDESANGCSADSEDEDDDYVDDVDPYDDDGVGGDVGRLAGRLGRVRFVQQQLEPSDSEEDDRDLADWRQFKQQLLNSGDDGPSSLAAVGASQEQP